MPLRDDASDPTRTLETLATAIVLLLTVGILYFAREILVPMSIAVLLSFVLSPLVRLLRKMGLGKRLSVGLVVVATFLIAVGLGFVLARQISDLAADAPNYQSTITRKVDGLRTFAAENPLLAKLNAAIADVTQPQKSQKPKSPPSPAQPTGPAPSAPPVDQGHKEPVQVQVVSPPPGVLTILQTAIGVAATPLAAAAFVAILIVFILMQREDLRNRFIRLAGGDLQRTTLAMNDAASRLSRYFLVQTLLNIGFGAAVALALTLIGVPSAVLWGIVAAFMRFIPYIGSIGSALFPILMAAAASPGWSLAIETAIFFAVAELFVGQVVEPLLYGHQTGISPIAVVMSATFWTWLWGPIGLVLSTPITVCLVVMGRHVHRLSFLDVLLGDAPALNEVEIFYQRMLVGDPSEILDHADDFIGRHSLLDYSDQVAMKALLMAQIDVRRGALDDARQLRIRDTMRDFAEDMIDRDDDPTPAKDIPTKDTPVKNTPTEDTSAKDTSAKDRAAAKTGAPAAHGQTGPDDADCRPKTEALPFSDVDPAWRHERAVLCFAGRTPLDEAAAHLLADLLIGRGIGAHVEPAESLARKDGDPLATDATRLAILSFLDADLSVAQARFAVRRLRRRLPDVPLVAAFWMAEQDESRIATLGDNVRCDACVSSLPQAVRVCLERAAPNAVADAA